MTRPKGYVVKHNCPHTSKEKHKHHRYGSIGSYDKPPKNYDFFLNWNGDGNKILEEATVKYKMSLHEVSCRVKSSFLNILKQYYGYVGSLDTAHGDEAKNARIRHFAKYLIDNEFKLWEWDK